MRGNVSFSATWLRIGQSRAPLVHGARTLPTRCEHPAPPRHRPRRAMTARAAPSPAASAPDTHGSAAQAGLAGEDMAAHAARAWAHWRALGAPRYVVAPMVDGSELAFREVCRRYGAELAYTPMLHSRIFSETAKYRAESFTTQPSDRPLVAQFCANDPHTLVTAARFVEGCVDAVDLNLGCPQGIARKGRYGSFLQDDWPLLRRIVGTAAGALKVPVWCKIRVFECRDRTVRYAQMLERAGASVIAVHGRTREQKGRSAPPADWDAIRAVKSAVSVPVIANGNVRCKADADEAMRYTGADAVMAAWALLDNPAVFCEGKRDMPSRLEVCREYLDEAEKLGTPMKMVRMHVFKMFRSRLDVNMDLNEAVAKCRSVQDFRAIADSIERRTDFGGISFEERLRKGEVEVNEICPRKKRKRDAAVGHALETSAVTQHL